MIAKILIRVPQTLKNQLQDTAKQQGHTLNALILQILWDWVEDKCTPRDLSQTL